MPSWSIHLKIAKEVNKKYNIEPNAFLFGFQGGWDAQAYSEGDEGFCRVCENASVRGTCTASH